MEAKIQHTVGKQFIASFVIKNGCRSLIGRDVLNKVKFNFEFNSIIVVQIDKKLITNLKKLRMK